MSSRQTVQMDHGSSDFDSVVNVGGVTTTLTTTQIFRGIMCSTPDVSIIFTFPTAAQLVAASPKIPIPGYCKRFVIRNDGIAPITIVAGKGGSINGSDTIAVSNYAAHYVLRFVSTTGDNEAYQIVRI